MSNPNKTRSSGWLPFGECLGSGASLAFDPAVGLHQLHRAVQSALPSLHASRAHLFARLHPPSALRESEAAEFDWDARVVRVLHADEEVSRGAIEQVGQFDRESQSWRWGWSVAPELATTIGEWADSEPLLDSFVVDEPLSTNEDQAHDIALWIAVSAGFLAAYPVVDEEAQTVRFAAIRLTAHADAVEHVGLWCTFCGTLPTRVETMIAGPDGRGACSECVQAFARVFSDDELDANIAEGANSGGPRCVLCDGDQAILAHTFAYLCQRCLRTCLEIVPRSG